MKKIYVLMTVICLLLSTLVLTGCGAGYIGVNKDLTDKTVALMKDYGLECNRIKVNKPGYIKIEGAEKYITALYDHEDYYIDLSCEVSKFSSSEYAKAYFDECVDILERTVFTAGVSWSENKVDTVEEENYQRVIISAPDEEGNIEEREHIFRNNEYVFMCGAVTDELEPLLAEVDELFAPTR